MRKQIRTIAAITLSGALAAMSGCSAIPREGGIASETSSQSAGSSGADGTLSESITDEASDTELFNAYITVNNLMAGRVNDSLARYFEYVKFQEEFALYEEGRYNGCYDVDYLIEDVEEAYSLVQAKAEKDDLDQSFLSLYPVLTDMMNVLDDIYEYADMKSYLDDDYARAREYHAKLWSDYTAYESLADDFMSRLSAVETERNAEALEQMKEEGLVAFYAVNCVINSAQALQMELYNQGITDETILDMNLESVQPLYDQFTADVESVLGYAEDEEQLTSEGIPVHSAYWSSFLSDMKDTKLSMTEVLEHVKNGEPLSGSDTLIALPGNSSLASFDAGISAMISDYNHFISY